MKNKKESKTIRILAIDTSCDETSIAILENENIIANVISTQTAFHKKYGGVVPSIARDKHKELLEPCIKKALRQAKITGHDIDYFAITYGPGLAIALEVGIAKIKELHKKYNKPVVAVNHLEGHLLSMLLKNKFGELYAKPIEFPVLGLTISGGHTQLVKIDKIGSYKLIGETLDDSAGEAFDKVARLLKLGYPGGPVIEKIAEDGDEKAYELPRPMAHTKDFNMSFSGLKTAALHLLRKLSEKSDKENKSNSPEVSFHMSASYYDSKDLFLTKKQTADFAASFQKAVVDSILIKVKKAVDKYDFKYVALGGGVVANKYLRKEFRKAMKKKNVKVSYPLIKFCTDNAAMIGIAAYHKIKRGEILRDVENLDREPILGIDKCNMH